MKAKNVTIKHAFDDNGNLKYDPYRFDRDAANNYGIALHDAVFTEGGMLKDREELADLIEDNPKWKFHCDAIGLYHAQTLASATKGSYPTYYFFR